MEGAQLELRCIWLWRPRALLCCILPGVTAAAFTGAGADQEVFLIRLAPCKLVRASIADGGARRFRAAVLRPFHAASAAFYERII
jgi:hypothetical protein